MKCNFCYEEAVASFDFGEETNIKGTKWLCQNHFDNFSKYANNLRRERQERERGEEWKDCDYCRGAYDDKGNYNPAKGKVFGRFNKITQECNNFGCNYYSFICEHCRKKSKGGLSIYCSETCKTRAGEKKKQKQKENERTFSQPCSECRGKLEGTCYYDRTGARKGKFCSRECYKTKRKKLVNSMRNWEDISKYNWENADWLDEEDKEKCREWVKNYQKREELKKKGKDYSTQQNNSSELEEETNKNIPSPTSSSDNSQNNSPTDSPFKFNQTPQDGLVSFSCPMCEKSWTSESEHNSQYPNCQRLMEIGEEASKNIERGKLNDISSLKELPHKFQVYLIALQDIKINKKKVNIDDLELPEETKQELKKLQTALKGKYGCGNCLRDDVNFDSLEELDKHMRERHGDIKSSPPILPKIFIGVSLILLLIFILWAIFRRKKTVQKGKSKRR